MNFIPSRRARSNKGDMYFTPGGTAFITADVDIPEEMQGEELWFSLKTAAEICVKGKR